jgi:dienelactone hydrolase
LLAAHDRAASRALPADLRFALHVPFYPSCSTQHYKPKSTGAPIYLLLGGADSYVGVVPRQEYAAALKAEGARVEVTVYPGAPHGFDTASAYKIAKGENYSKWSSSSSRMVRGRSASAAPRPWMPRASATTQA